MDPADALEFVGSIGGIEDRIRTESSAEIVLVLRGDELARRRAGEVQMIGLGLHDEPSVGRRLRRRSDRTRNLPNNPRCTCRMSPSSNR